MMQLFNKVLQHFLNSFVLLLSYDIQFIHIIILKSNSYLELLSVNTQIQKNMFNKMVVYEALKRSMTSESNRRLTPDNQTKGQDSLISLLIHDIFGGEILKTHTKKYWHFYNRIDGERVDFTSSKNGKSTIANSFEDIPSTPDETHDYFDQVDYSTFLMRFVRAFEETVGLDKYRSGLPA